MFIRRLRESQAPRGYASELVLDEDRQLAKEEARLLDQEESTSHLEKQFEKEIQETQERQMDLLARVEAVDEEVLKEGRDVLERIPGLTPSFFKKDKKQAVEARRKAIASRRSAIERRKRRASLISEGLRGLSRALDDSEEEIARLQEEAHRRRTERLAIEKAARESEALRNKQLQANRSNGRGIEVRVDGGPEAQRKDGPADGLQTEQLSDLPDAQPHGRVEGRPMRRFQRTHLDCEVGLATDTNFYAGFAQNLSAGGLFVATFDLLPVGREIDLCFSLPSGLKISTKAVVRWVRDPNALSSEVWPGMGLQFQGLPIEAVEAIESFGREREPLFFPDA